MFRYESWKNIPQTNHPYRTRCALVILSARAIDLGDCLPTRIGWKRDFGDFLSLVKIFRIIELAYQYCLLVGDTRTICLDGGVLFFSVFFLKFSARSTLEPVY